MKKKYQLLRPVEPGQRWQKIRKVIRVLFTIALLTGLGYLIFIRKPEVKFVEVQPERPQIEEQAIGGCHTNTDTVSVEIGHVVEEQQHVSVPGTVRGFVEAYPGSRIDSGYLQLLADTCNDEHTLKKVIAVAVSESGMGRDTPWKSSNFWGYFKGGDRGYDPSKEQMAKDICFAMKEGYPRLVSETGDVHLYSARIYVYGQNSGDVSGWMGRVRWAWQNMN